MSGVEPIAIIGLISSVITIIETSRQLYDAATNAKGLHEAFRTVSIKVPLVLEILRKCKIVQDKADLDYRNTIDLVHKRELESSAEAVRPIMLTCEENARKLQAIFEKVIPGEQATWLERYMKAAQSITPGKKHKVEELMKDILEKLQLLQTDQFFKAVAEEKSEDISAAIEDLSAAPPSLPDDGDAARFSNFGSGPMNVQTGLGRQVNPTLSGGTNGKQYIAETQHFADK